MDPQTCTKCSCLPEDILMLACSHDLCLNCAADRLAFEMKKTKKANSIVCEFCYERTPLDAESVSELEKLIHPSKLPVKSHVEPTNSYMEANKKSDYRVESTGHRSNLPEASAYRNQRAYEKSSALGIDRGYDRTADRRTVKPDAFTGLSDRKSCTEHPDEEILYFCFDCKCECICPECIIHGKHKEHDVKTIRKAQPIVKNEVSGSIERMENNVEGLLIRKSEAEKQMRSLTEQNNVSKRQIQQAFEDLRAKINSQEKMILSRFDQNLTQNLEGLDRTQKSIHIRIDELKGQTATLQEALRKEDILFLNYYSRKCQEIQAECREPDVKIPQTSLASNESILSEILDVSDQVGKIGGNRRQGH